MAKQFSVIVSGNEYLFPSCSVMITELSSGSRINFYGSIFDTSSSISDLVALANDGGTEQIQLTVLRVNSSVQTNSIQMSFPVNNIIVNDSNLSGSNSVITFNGIKYYVSETQSAILSSANTSSGGGSVSIPDTSYDNNTDAVAALGVGVLYKSTTLINDSPIILITV